MLFRYRHIFEILLVIGLLLPLVRINNPAPVDWGDDNFQYLSQARNLHEGKITTETGFIYKDYARGMGPPAYPTGYPILLALFCFWGDNEYACAQTMTGVFLLLTGLGIFLWSRKYLNFGASLFLVALICYSPDALQLRSEIMSDYPFMAFLIWSILGYEEYLRVRKPAPLILAAIAAAIAICIRSVAWIWICSVLAYSGVELIRSRFKNIKQLIPPAVFSAITIFIFLVLQVLLLPVDTGNSYQGQFFDGGISKIISSNYSWYRYYFDRSFSEQPVTGIGITVFGLTLIGLVIKKRFILHPVGWMTVFQIVLLFAVWPHSAYRYFLSLLVFIYFFSIFALQEIITKHLKRLQPLVWIGFGIWLGLHLKPQYKIREHAVKSTDTPLTAEGMETWKKIGTLPASSVIAFHRPRALHYLTRRKSFILPLTANKDSLMREMESSNARYFLEDLVNREYQEGTEALAADTSLAQLIWENDRFRLYELR